MNPASPLGISVFVIVVNVSAQEFTFKLANRMDLYGFPLNNWSILKLSEPTATEADPSYKA